MRKEHLVILDSCLDLFEFKSISDKKGNEYVFYKSSEINPDDLYAVDDKTAFEAFQNHVHIFENIRTRQKTDAIKFAKKLGSLLIKLLSLNFPDKHFVVFVTVNDSVTIRFHQKWHGEPWYFITEEKYDGSELIWFEN